MTYIQGAKSEDIYYSHFDELFLSQLDLHSFSGWIQPGKGCGENCVYCGGTRGMQKASFGRAKPFLRPEQSVLRDHQDTTRALAPLRKAADAITVDTTDLDVEQVVEAMLRTIESQCCTRS